MKTMMISNWTYPLNYSHHTYTAWVKHTLRQGKAVIHVLLTSKIFFNGHSATLTPSCYCYVAEGPQIRYIGAYSFLTCPSLDTQILIFRLIVLGPIPEWKHFALMSAEPPNNYIGQSSFSWRSITSRANAHLWNPCIIDC